MTAAGEQLSWAPRGPSPGAQGTGGAQPLLLGTRACPWGRSVASVRARAWQPRHGSAHELSLPPFVASVGSLVFVYPPQSLAYIRNPVSVPS